MKKIFILFLLLFAPGAYADCKFAGEDYPEGTVVNGYVCGADGKWKSKS